MKLGVGIGSGLGFDFEDVGSGLGSIAMSFSATGAGTDFDPTQIAGLTVWLSGSAGTAGASIHASGGSIDTWDDQSGGANNATGSGASRPVNKTTSPKGGTWNDSILNTPNVSLGAYTAFIVFKISVEGILTEQSNNANGNPGFFTYGNSPAISAHKAALTSQKHENPNSWSGDNTLKYACQSYGGTHATHNLYINGTLGANLDGVNADPGTGTTTDALHIGNRVGLGVGIVGDVYEVIVYNSALSDADRGKVDTYIKKLYGIS